MWSNPVSRAPGYSQKGDIKAPEEQRVRHFMQSLNTEFLLLLPLWLVVFWSCYPGLLPPMRSILEQIKGYFLVYRLPYALWSTLMAYRKRDKLLGSARQHCTSASYLEDLTAPTSSSAVPFLLIGRGPTIIGRKCNLLLILQRFRPPRQVLAKFINLFIAFLLRVTETFVWLQTKNNCKN